MPKFQSRKRFIVPIVTIALGVTWLLNVMDVIPGVDWIWTAGLALVGILSLAIGGINRVTIVLGPFFVIAAVCALLRQTGTLPIDREIPILTAILGVLLLVAQLTKLPMPEFFDKNHDHDHDDPGSSGG